MTNVHVVAVGNQNETVYPKSALEAGTWIYLHGKLESMNQYDITMFINGTKPNAIGRYECIVHMNDGSFIPAVLVMYQEEFMRHISGLVVAKDDDLETIMWVLGHLPKQS